MRFCFLIFVSGIGVLHSHEPWFYTIKNPQLFRFTLPEIEYWLNYTYGKTKKHNSKYKYLVTDDERLNLATFERIPSVDLIDPKTFIDSLFVVFFHTDDDYCYQLKKITEGGGKYFSIHHFLKTRYLWTDKHSMIAYDKTLSFGNKTSHHKEVFSLNIHETICQCINITKHLPGDYVEIGVYMGGSALTALHYMDSSGIKRKSYFIDTYDGFNYEEAHKSPDVLWDNSHKLWGVSRTMKYIQKMLQTTHQDFELVAANICRDSLPNKINQISVCNIDVDMYEATLAALTQVAPRVVKRGIIICEDPTSTPGLSGALLAMNEFLETPEGKKFVKVLASAQYLLIKIED